jgi:phosphoribosyl-ATP pyrophosphohydrolase
MVAARAAGAPPGSYVGGLLAAGPSRALQKLGEEAVEAVIAGLRAPSDPAAATGEFADVLFHLLVAMAACGVPASAVAAELERRRRLRPAREPGIPASGGGIP